MVNRHLRTDDERRAFTYQNFEEYASQNAMARYLVYRQPIRWTVPVDYCSQRKQTSCRNLIEHLRLAPIRRSERRLVRVKRIIQAREMCLESLLEIGQVFEIYLLKKQSSLCLNEAPETSSYSIEIRNYHKILDAPGSEPVRQTRSTRSVQKRHPRSLHSFLRSSTRHTSSLTRRQGKKLCRRALQRPS